MGKALLELVLIEVLADPLYLCCLEEADQFEVLPHRVLPAWEFGDHGPGWEGGYLRMS